MAKNSSLALLTSGQDVSLVHVDSTQQLDSARKSLRRDGFNVIHIQHHRGSGRVTIWYKPINVQLPTKPGPKERRNSRNKFGRRK